jgi:hypothetical protein
VRRLECKDIEYLLELVHDNSDYFLDEFVSLARTNHFISIHFTTVFNELERTGMSRKKLKYDERALSRVAGILNICVDVPRFRFLEIVGGDQNYESTWVDSTIDYA